MDHSNKQYCWHASVVDYAAREAMVLRPSGEDEAVLEIVSAPLIELMEQTLELIGTNVNGNPYGERYRCILSDPLPVACVCLFVYLFTLMLFFLEAKACLKV